MAAPANLPALMSQAESATSDVPDYSLGCRLPLADWLALNRDLVFDQPALRRFVAPFPPGDLMEVTTGVRTEKDFAVQGALLYETISAASPVPLHAFPSWLDFGCGSGRLARMFKGFPGRMAGCDIDSRLVAWCQSSLGYVDVRRSGVKPPTPFADGEFAAIVSISIFTHLSEASQDAFLDELSRISRPDALLFLTTHGERAMERAQTQPHIRAMLEVSDAGFEQACSDFDAGRHAFILQPTGHLTTLVDKQLHAGKVIAEPYEYGITLIPEAYVRSHWSRWFDIVDYRSGAIHDFQDIVVLRPKPRPAPPSLGAKLKSVLGSLFGGRG
jgi:SAM-dependent methyltransferase